MCFFFFSFILCSSSIFFFFFFNDTATTEIYTLSLHDALPILDSPWWLLPAYVAAVYAFKRATMRLAEWLFAPDFWWQVTSIFLTTFLLACLACVVSLSTSSIWIG